MPADIQLAGMEVSLVNAMSRETILRQYLDTLRGQYSHILLDCQPSLGMMTINALAAANRLVIPVQAEYLPAKGLEQLLKTVAKVKRNINPQLQIEGILLTMVDSRTNFAREISQLIRDTYGGKIRVFDTAIPYSVRAKECSAAGQEHLCPRPQGQSGGSISQSHQGGAAARKNNAKQIKLASVDDLFATDEIRADAQREKVVELPLEQLHPFRDHPFKVLDDDAMRETVESVERFGVLVPAIARPDPEGGYELVAGHRRHRACALAGMETMPVIVRELDDDAATILMVDSVTSSARRSCPVNGRLPTR